MIASYLLFRLDPALSPVRLERRDRDHGGAPAAPSLPDRESYWGGPASRTR